MREGGKEGRKEGVREGGKEGGKEGVREGGSEGGWERKSEREGKGMIFQKQQTCTFSNHNTVGCC